MSSKKNKTTAEQTAQDKEKNNQAEQVSQEQEADQTEQVGQEQEADQIEQTGQEQEADQIEQTGQKSKPSNEPERDEFADIPNPCVYCGPSVRGVARQYTTYQGGIPAELKEFIKAHPAARGLIIPTAKFASVRKRLETHGTAEAIIYKGVKDEL